MSQNYVYAYLNPLEEGIYHSNDISFLAKPFYIGKGTGDRLYDHLKDARPSRKYKHNHKLNTIRLIQQSGLNPIIIKIQDGLSEKEALKLELNLIRDLKTRYGLTNIRTNNWNSAGSTNTANKKFNNPRKDTITIYNSILNEHSIIKSSQLSIYNDIFGETNITVTTGLKVSRKPKTQMARNGEKNGMFGKSAVQGKKWCIVDNKEKFLSPDEIENLRTLNYNIIYGRLTKPAGKRIIFEGELKGKYRTDDDISKNPNKKYQYGLVWNATKQTFLNHKQI